MGLQIPVFEGADCNPDTIVGASRVVLIPVEDKTLMEQVKMIQELEPEEKHVI